MTNLNTTISRNHYGLIIETTVDLPNNRILVFETWRRYSKELVTSIGAYEKIENGRKSMIGKDYHQQINHGNVGRLTIPTLKDRHSVVLTAITSFEKEAIEFYNQQ